MNCWFNFEKTLYLCQDVFDNYKKSMHYFHLALITVFLAIPTIIMATCGNNYENLIILS